MANKHPNDGTSSAVPATKRQKTGGAKITHKKRFEGTNIDILKANRARSGDRVPLSSDSSDSSHRSAESASYPPPDSVGRLFTPPIRVNDVFVEGIRAPKMWEDQEPLGIHNLGNHCYRNSVLTMLINSESLMKYVKRYSKIESAYSMTKLCGSRSILFSLVIFATINEASDPCAHRQRLLNSRIDQFWQEVGYPTLARPNDLSQLLFLPPHGTWQRFSGSNSFDQLDAHEFLSWICTVVDGQLSQHHNIKDFRMHKNNTSTQQDFDWLTMVRRAPRVDCPGCRWRVQRRVRIGTDRGMILNIPDPDFPASTDDQASRQPLRLEDCVSAVLHEEIPKEWRCPRCSRTDTGAVKRFKFQQTPEVLFVTLARGLNHFEGPQLNADGSTKYDERGNLVNNNVGKKDFTAVTIPETLDISAWLNHHQYGPGSHVSYRLAGVVSHRGGDLKWGHYHSYVRGGQDRNKWFELNDDIVRQCLLSDFDDSQAHGMDKQSLRERFTPYIMLYEKDHANEVYHPGFHTININEGDEVDARPGHWTGLSPPPQAPKSPSSSANTAKTNESDGEDEDVEIAFFEDFSGNNGWSHALLDIVVTIDGTNFRLPQHAIRHFDKSKARSAKIKAILTVPKGTREEVDDMEDDEVEWSQMDLAQAYIDAEVEQVEKEKEAASMARRKGQYRRSLRKVKLSEEELEERIEQEEDRLDTEFEKWKACRKQKSWAKRWKKL